jgi:hypothetical protein
LQYYQNHDHYEEVSNDFQWLLPQLNNHMGYFEKTITADQGCRRRGSNTGRIKPSTFKITQEDANKDVCVSQIKNSDPEHGWEGI